MLSYIDLDPDKMKLTTKQVLVYIYEYTIFAALLPNSSRDQTTQQFYEKILPEFIQEKIAAYQSSANENQYVRT